MFNCSDFSNPFKVFNMFNPFNLFKSVQSVQYALNWYDGDILPEQIA